MWTSFALCLLVCAALLYIPGLFVFRGLGFNTTSSLVLAPVAFVAFVGLVPIAYDYLHIPCTAPSVLGIIIVGCIAPHLFSKILKLKPVEPAFAKWDAGMIVAYGLFGMALCLYMFIKPLDGADSFYCRADNATHLNMVRHFIESGQWSSLGASTGTLAYPAEGNGFYPSAWHGLAALVSLIAQADPIVAINATNAIVCGLVYPLAAFSLMNRLFPNSKLVAAVGIVTTCAVACFPWTFLIKGPLVSNLLSYALMPAVLSLFLYYLDVGIVRHWKGAAVAACLSIFSLALSQPNGLFAVLVFIAPLLAHRAMARFPKHRMAAFFATTLGFIALWFALLNAPSLASVVFFPNQGGLTLTVRESIEAVITFSLYAGQPAQTLLAVICLIGCAAAIRRKTAWLIFPAAYMLVAYGVSRCTDGYLRNVLCGFWYNDPWRLADAGAVFLAPLAALGLTTLVAVLARCFTQKILAAHNGPCARRITTASATKVTACIVLIVFACYNFFPSYPNPITHKRTQTSFGFMRDRIAKEYSTSRDQIYSHKEKLFVDKALEVIPDGALVVNSPEDGSLFAYGVNGINTLFRHRPTGTMIPDADILRQRLSHIASDAEVQEAVARTSAQYVLLLDQGVSFDEGRWLLQTTEESLRSCDGINLITDDTPGFELVLAEDDMRLYKISPEYTSVTS
ncbi:hypothetical protein F8D48_10235 [Adlercreutzia muris]|uniref:Uncharacterized protein n=1 Tax=Adlercreutzia muris TaxID=1796610 RepID=A0A7C8FW08_9ACTN|nr:DUF6541 family protein [Adlercreutzia muris]KAB1640713.1 hypothetical protein F8D48_10235 [Adlercreutzia muris]